MAMVQAKRCSEHDLLCPVQECETSLIPPDITDALSAVDYQTYLRVNLELVLAREEKFVMCPHPGCGVVIERVSHTKAMAAEEKRHQELVRQLEGCDKASAGAGAASKAVGEEEKQQKKPGAGTDQKGLAPQAAVANEGDKAVAEAKEAKEAYVRPAEAVEGEAAEVEVEKAVLLVAPAAESGWAGMAAAVLSEAELHKKEYRMRCPNGHIFCASCRNEPYHEDRTCREHKMYAEACKCRFCGSAIAVDDSNRHVVALTPPPVRRPKRQRGKALLAFAARVASGSLSAAAAASSSSSSTTATAPTMNVCTDEECVDKVKLACTKVLRCGHPCVGIKGEGKCMPCLTDGCRAHKGSLASKHAKLSQCGPDFCNICWVEPLEQAPCIQLSCGHIFHASCVREKLVRRWSTSRITFAFADCPLCGTGTKICHPSLSDELLFIDKLQDEIRKKARLRLTYEKLELEPALRDRSSPFFNKQADYAMKLFAYYMCFKCKRPYFGGQVRCEAAAVGGEEDGGGRDGDFDPSELVCGGCSAGVGETACSIHGKEFIEFKCKFCCAVANWYCWGNTHFCDECHKKQMHGNYMTRKKPEQLSQCRGGSKCRLKLASHPPNGQEFSLGCSLCRGTSVGF